MVRVLSLETCNREIKMEIFVDIALFWSLDSTVCGMMSWTTEARDVNNE